MYVRRLPSGKWQATVRLHDGKRRTHTAPLKGEVVAWATEQESRLRRDGQYDPGASRMLYDEWRDKWWSARVVEQETRRGDAGVLRNHLDPHFTGRRVASLGRIEVQAWVRKLEQGGVGAHAIRRAYNLLTTMLGAAVLEGVIPVSPCRKIDLPATPPKYPAWFTPEQATAIVQALPERHGIAAALMMWTGLRWGEMAGLRVQDVDWSRGRVSVVGSRTQMGAWKEYPKSSKSRREVPVPARVLALLAPLAEGRDGDETLFTTVRGGRPWSGANWRGVWDEAIERAGVPHHPPHTCRHTAASWLVQAGVALYDVQRLLGHESFATTQRYAHLAPDAHASVTQAWASIDPPALAGVPLAEDAAGLVTLS
jgi:integrase